MKQIGISQRISLSVTSTGRFRPCSCFSRGLQCADRLCVFSQCLRLVLVTIISGCERRHHLSQLKTIVTSPYYLTLNHCFSPDLFLVTFTNCRPKATRAMHFPANKPPPDALPIMREAKNKHRAHAAN